MQRNSLLGTDLLVFVDIASEILIEPKSSRRIAEILSASPSSLHKKIQRLNSRFAGPVLMSTENKLYLTSLGRQIYDDLLRSLEDCGHRERPQTLRVAASQALVTSGLLASAIRDFVERKGRFVRIDISLNSTVDMEDVILSLHRETLDFAFIWGTEDRIAALTNSGIPFKELDVEFDVVLVSSNQWHINRANVACKNSKDENRLDFLSEVAFAFLQNHAQACEKLIPFPSPLKGGRRVRVDSVEAAVACVRSHLADAAIVPAIYSDLHRFKQLGQLNYSEKIGSIKILAVRSPTSSLAFIEEFTRDVANLLRISSNREYWAPARGGKSGPHLSSFPIGNPEWYEKLKFGYFIGADILSESGEIQWCWELIELRSTKNRHKNNSHLAFEGAIVNELGAVFDIVEAIASKEAFIIRAVVKSGLGGDMEGMTTSSEFTSVFTSCMEKEGVMSGVWCGKDRDGNPGVFGTVWSHEILELDELRILAIRSSFQSIISAVEGRNFDHQHDPARVKQLTQLF